MRLRNFGLAWLGVLLLSLLAGSGARADESSIIFDNGEFNWRSVGVSDFGFQPAQPGDFQQIADDFVLQPGLTRLSSVYFWGIYVFDDTPTEPDNFTIRIFEDAGNAPALTPLHELNVVGVERIDTNVDFLSFDHYEYRVEVEEITLQADVTYWLSIVNDTSADTNDVWLWSASLNGQGNSLVRIGDGAAWTPNPDTSNGPFEFGFNLRGGNPGIRIEKSTNGVDADDAAAGDAPVVAIGDAVTWAYEVTNTGNCELLDVSVSDDQGVAVSCPLSTLGVGASMTCSASAPAEDLLYGTANTVPGVCDGLATALYENTGTASASTADGEPVSDSDSSHYCNPPGPPAIAIDKQTNGVDADSASDPNVPEIAAGTAVTWTYRVENTGGVALEDLAIVDDHGTPLDAGDDLCTSGGPPGCANPIISCPATELDPGSTMQCSASAAALDLNNPPGGFTPVSGMCAGLPDRPLYANLASVTGSSLADGTVVAADDASHYCNPPSPALDIETATNATDADDPNAPDVPQVEVGSSLEFTYDVTNTGDAMLMNVSVLDGESAPVSCPKTTLMPGDSMTCVQPTTAADSSSGAMATVPGLCGGIPQSPLFATQGSATGETQSGTQVAAADPTHYCNQVAIERAVCVETDATATLTPMQTKVFDVEKFFNVEPASCPTGFIVAYARDDTIEPKQPVSFNYLTGSAYVRDSGPGHLHASAEQAVTIQSPANEGEAVGMGGAFPELPFDGVSFARLPNRYVSDFRSYDQQGAKGSRLTLLDLDITATLQNGSRLVAVDATNQAEVGFSGSLEFACHIQLPIERIPGIGASLVKSNFGSSFGKLELELFEPVDDGGVLALIGEFERNRSTLRKMYQLPADDTFLGQQPGSVVVYPLFDVAGSTKTTIRLTNNHPSEEANVQFYRVCGQGSP